MPINIYTLVGPFVLVLIIVEFIYCLVKKYGYYSFQDSVIGLGTMIFSQCVNVGIAAIILSVYGWIYSNYAIFHFEPTWVHYVVAYIIGDFLFYWFHRVGHRVNFFWGAHAGHHSAEELNYAVALRTTIFQRAASFMFYWPLAVLGFSPQVILTAVAINLVYQFLPHTRVVPKLPSWIDSWLNTPYHHRIHHAANEIYWDRNYGGTLIIWDRIFGTFRDETEVPYYGITIHPKSWDPTYINFHWYSVLWNDMIQATHFSDKIKLWFMPPGWRPRNLPPYSKDQIGKTALNQVKFLTTPYEGVNTYLIAQMIFIFPLLFFITSSRTPVNGTEQIYFSFLIWAAVTMWGALMEKKKWALKLEALRILITTASLVFVFTKYEINPIWTYCSLGVSAVYLVWLNFIKVQSSKALRA